MKVQLVAALVLAVASLPGCKSSSSCPHCDAAVDSAATSTSPATPRNLESFQFTTHDGKTLRFGDLKGAPTAISFVYTRCQNQRKCPLVARTMAELQSEIDRENMNPAPKLALITYDPEYDTPARLREFGAKFGLLASTNTFLLRPEPTKKMDLFKELNVAVNFNAGAVNLHGIQLLLFDKNGQPAEAYRGLIWNNSKVLADLKALAAQQAN